MTRDLLGEIDSSDYRVDRLKASVQAVSEILKDPKDPYFSIKSLKNKLKDETRIKIGRKRLSFILRKLNWNYRGKIENTCAKNLKELPENYIDRFCRVVSNQIEADSTAEVVFSDEFKAPLYQSSLKFWRKHRKKNWHSES